MDNISRDTLNKVVVSLRNSGMTYQDIADTIYKDYGIKRTRQAIHSIYTKAIEENSLLDISKDYHDIVCNVAKLYALGYAIDEVVTILKENDIAITLNDANDIVVDNSYYINNIKNYIKATVTDAFNGVISKDEMKNKLSHLGHGIKEPMFKHLVSQVALGRIYDCVSDEAGRAAEFVGDSDMADILRSQFA